MASPMLDLPDHYSILVNADGDGPAGLDEAIRTVCWCGDVNCSEEPARELEPPR